MHPPHSEALGGFRGETDHADTIDFHFLVVWIFLSYTVSAGICLQAYVWRAKGLAAVAGNLCFLRDAWCEPDCKWRAHNQTEWRIHLHHSYPFQVSYPWHVGSDHRGNTRFLMLNIPHTWEELPPDCTSINMLHVFAFFVWLDSLYSTLRSYLCWNRNMIRIGVAGGLEVRDQKLVVLNPSATVPTHSFLGTHPLLQLVNGLIAFKLSCR